MNNLSQFIEQDKEIMHEAVQTANDYKENHNIEDAKRVIYLLLDSKITKYKRRIEEARIKLKGADFFQKGRLKREIDQLSNKVKELESIKAIDFDNNNYLNGKISNHYASIYEDVDRNIYTLFNEVASYFKDGIDEKDQDRKSIQSRLDKFENKIMIPRRDAYTVERKYIRGKVDTLFEEVSSMYPRVELLANCVNGARKGFENNKNEHYAYIADLTMNHSPKYEEHYFELANWFGVNAKSNSSGALQKRLLGIGRDAIQEIIAPKGFSMSKIKDLIERREEVIELHELIERAMFSLERNNNMVVGSNKGTTVNYDEAIQFGNVFIEFCENLINKYDKALEELRYSELIDLINQIEKGTYNKEEVHEEVVETRELPIEKFKSVKPVVEEEKVEVESAELNLEEENNRRIGELGLTDEMLELSSDDLYMFGIIESADLEQLSPIDMSKVIEHVEELRSLAQYSDTEKAKKRAEWPRIEFGKYIIPQDVSESEIQVQKLRDNSNGRNIYQRINSLFGEMPKL